MSPSKITASFDEPSFEGTPESPTGDSPPSSPNLLPPITQPWTDSPPGVKPPPITSGTTKMMTLRSAIAPTKTTIPSKASFFTPKPTSKPKTKTNKTTIFVETVESNSDSDESISIKIEDTKPAAKPTSKTKNTKAENITKTKTKPTKPRTKTPMKPRAKTPQPMATTPKPKNPKPRAKSTPKTRTPKSNETTPKTMKGKNKAKTITPKLNTPTGQYFDTPEDTVTMAANRPPTPPPIQHPPTKPHSGPTIKNPNHPDFSTNQPTNTPTNNTTFNPINNPTTTTNHTKPFAIKTPSVNGLPSGTTINIKMNHKLKFNKFSHFHSPEFITEQNDPLTLINSTITNSINNFKANSLQTMFTNIHHPTLTFADDDFKLLHTPRVHPVEEDWSSPAAKEITMIEGTGQEGTLWSINANLSMFDTTETNIPMIETLACPNFNGYEETPVPPHLMTTKMIGASYILPLQLGEAIANYAPSNLHELFDILVGLITINKERTMEKQGINYIRLAAFPGKITSCEEVFTHIDIDLYNAIRPYEPIINTILHIMYNSTKFTSGISLASNPKSIRWFNNITYALQSESLNYNQALQDKDTLGNITIKSARATPCLPFGPEYTEEGDPSDIPTGRGTTQSRRPPTPFLTPRKSSLQPSLRQNTINFAIGKIKLDKNIKKPTLSKRQSTYQNDAKVILPNNKRLRFNEDDETTPSPRKKIRPTNVYDGIGQLSIESNDEDEIMTEVNDEMEQEFDTIQTQTKQYDGPNASWKPPRVPTPFIDDEMPIDFDQDEETTNMPFSDSPKSPFEFPYNMNSHNNPNHHTNNNYFNTDSLAGAHFPNTNQHQFPSTNFNNSNAKNPTNIAIQNANQTEQVTLGFLKEIGKVMHRGNELQAQQIRQTEEHFIAKDNKKIADGTRQQHKNAGTTDGIHPATDITEDDKECLTAKTTLEVIDRMEPEMAAKGATTHMTMNMGNALKTGHWHSPRFNPGQLTVFQLFLTTANTLLANINIEQANYDRENGRQISRRAERVLTQPILIVPRNMHYLIEALRAMFVLMGILLGNKAIITRATLVWYNWIETNKQHLIEMTQHGHDNLPAKIAQCFDNSMNNYFIASQTGVPSSSILDCSTIMQQILDGTGNIHLYPIVNDAIKQRQNGNNRRDNNNNNNNNNNNKNNNSNGNSNRNYGQGNERSQRVTHNNQPRSLQVSPQVYAKGVAPAISSRAVTVPQHNGLGECLRYSLRGYCTEDCMRANNHTAVTQPERQRNLEKVRRECKNWYNNNKPAGGPDFH